jgi:hypothetical protein
MRRGILTRAAGSTGLPARGLIFSALIFSVNLSSIYIGWHSTSLSPSRADQPQPRRFVPHANPPIFDRCEHKRLAYTRFGASW